MNVNPNVLQLTSTAEPPREVADRQTSGQGDVNQPLGNVRPNPRGAGISAQQATGDSSRFPEQMSGGTIGPGASELDTIAEAEEENQQGTITCRQLELNSGHTHETRHFTGEPQQSTEFSLENAGGHGEYSMETLAQEEPIQEQITNEPPANEQQAAGQLTDEQFTEQFTDELFGEPIDWTRPENQLTVWPSLQPDLSVEEVANMDFPATDKDQTGDASFGVGVGGSVEVATATAGPSHALASNDGHVGVNASEHTVPPEELFDSAFLGSP